MTQPPSSPVADLGGYRVKRQRRRQRGAAAKERRRNQRELARFLIAWEPLHAIAAVFPQWQPGDRGRPPDLPPAAHILFGIMYLECGSGDKAEAFFDDPAVWHTIRTALATRYPGYRGLRPDAAPITRSEFWRFRERHVVVNDLLGQLRDTFRTEAVAVARDLGFLDATRGTLSQPDTMNMAVGDGTVAKSRFRHTADDRQLDVKTGELEAIRHDPDADTFRTGNSKKPYGLKFGFLSLWSEHEMERVIADVFSITNLPGRGEAAEAVRAVDQLADLAPELQGVAWDMALRGKHNKKLRRRGLTDVVKVSKTTGTAGKLIPAPLGPHGTRRTGHVFTRTDITTEELSVYTFFGHPHIEVIAEGERHHVPLIGGKRHRSRERTDGSHGRARYRQYRDYTISEDPRIPQHLRGATVTIRLTENKDDRALGYKRCEHLRPVTIFDGQEWERLYSLRPRAESLNRWIKKHFSDKRAPAVGIPRNLFMLFCIGLLNNAKAVLAHHARLKQAA